LSKDGSVSTRVDQSAQGWIGPWVDRSVQGGSVGPGVSQLFEGRIGQSRDGSLSPGVEQFVQRWIGQLRGEFDQSGGDLFSSGVNHSVQGWTSQSRSGPVVGPGVDCSVQGLAIVQKQINSV